MGGSGLVVLEDVGVVVTWVKLRCSDDKAMIFL
jgi:hypothetical protein